MNNVEKLILQILNTSKEGNTGYNYDGVRFFMCPCCFKEVKINNTDIECVLDDSYHEPDCIVLLVKEAAKEI